MTEHEWDRALRIKTAGTLSGIYQSAHYNRYEATPYAGLEALFEEYGLKPDGHFVDFGCGKGRVPFYVHRKFGITATGIEMSGHLYQEALENQASYMAKTKQKKGSVHFIRTFAEEYPINPEDSMFYFFNPFSVQIFMTVISRILESAEQNPRPVTLILYFPTADYIQFAEQSFKLIGEVKVPGLYERNSNERFMIFRK
ncbi:class I SAM-dependent methyltransferase [Planococcus lenghuensis]|uniref:SAM-dependent methyltransferase n=1 Tax=Planococcus lenghuensis TaxID=2213202 RepID=A0A1Q2L278_9BACL|nr:class I SAM-dependent methyltransferase [Planococcus lenghuensis]AQQ54531.1 SAM-dependent methyltransferase [Planococcus lenghuensis]